MKLLKRLRAIALLVIVMSVLVYLIHPASLDVVAGLVGGWLTAALAALQSFVLQPLLGRMRPMLARVTLPQLLIGAAVAWFVFVLVLVLLARSGRPPQMTADAVDAPSEQMRPAHGQASAPTREMQGQPADSPDSYARLPAPTALPEYSEPNATPFRWSGAGDPSFDTSGEGARDDSPDSADSSAGAAPRIMPFAVPAASLAGRREPEYEEWPSPPSGPSIGAGAVRRGERPAARNLAHEHVVALTGISPVGNRALPYGVFFAAEDAGQPNADGASSKRALEFVTEQVVASLVNLPALDSDQLASQLDFAVLRASIDQRQPEQGTALRQPARVAGILIVGTHAYVVNAGEFRTFMFRLEGGITPMTPDHSVISYVAHPGQRDPVEEYTNAMERRMSGEQGAIGVDAFQVGMQPHDLLVLCSSGLWQALRPEQIEAIIRAAPSLSGAAHLLVCAGADGSVAILVRAVPHQMPQFGLASRHAEGPAAN